MSLGHLLVIGINFPVVSDDVDITENVITTGTTCSTCSANSTDYQPHVVALYVLYALLFIAVGVSLTIVVPKVRRNTNRSKYAKKQAEEDSKTDQHQMKEQK